MRGKHCITYHAWDIRGRGRGTVRTLIATAKRRAVAVALSDCKHERRTYRSVQCPGTINVSYVLSLAIFVARSQASVASHTPPRVADTGRKRISGLID